MVAKLVDTIRQKSREEWEDLPREKITELRIWIQEHSEQAAVVSFFVGILTILFFKIVLIILILALIAAFAVWFVALPGRSITPPAETRIAPEDSDDPDDKGSAV